MRTCSYRDHRGQDRCTECGETIELCKCPNPDELATYRLNSATGRALRATLEGILLDRGTRFGNEDAFLRISEQLGLLTSKVITYDRIATPQEETETPQEVTQPDLFREIIKLSVVTLRFATEGDASHYYDPQSILGE